MQHMLGLLIAAFSLISSSAAFATSLAPAEIAPIYACLRNFYVTTGGSDSHGCTNNAGDACGTPQGAINKLGLTGGDCLILGAGTFPITGGMSLKGGNSSAQNGSGLLTGFVSYVGAPNHGTHIQATAGFDTMVRSTGNYIIWDGIDTDANRQASGYAWGNTGNHHLIVMNAIIHDSGTGGLGGGGIGLGGDFNYVFNSEIYNNNSSWLSAISMYDPLDCGCANGANPFDTQHYHIGFYRNVIYNNGSGPNNPHGSDTDGNAISFDNLSRSQQAPPGNIPYPDPAIAQGNVAWNNGGQCVQIVTSGSGHIDVVNNTCWKNSQDAANGGNERGEILLAGDPSVTVENNILYAVPGGGSLGNNVAIYWDGGNTTFSNNVTFGGTTGNCGSSVTIIRTSNDGGNCTAARAANKIDQDPLFVSLISFLQYDRDLEPPPFMLGTF